MDTIDFIFQKATDKFVRDAEDDLYKYKRILEKKIEKGERVPEAKKALAEVNKKLGLKESKSSSEGAMPTPNDSWKKEQEAKRKVFEAKVKESLKEHFS